MTTTTTTTPAPVLVTSLATPIDGSRTLPFTITKINETIEIVVPPVSLEWCLAHGLDAKVNDGHSAVKRTDFDSDEAFTTAVRAKAYPILKMIVEGTLPSRKGPAIVTEDMALAALAKKYNLPIEQVKAMFAPAAAATTSDSVLIPAGTVPATTQPNGKGRRASA